MNDSLRRIAPAVLAAALIIGSASGASALGNGTAIHFANGMTNDRLDLTRPAGVEAFVAKLNAEAGKACGPAPLVGGKSRAVIDAFGKANATYQMCSREAKQVAALRILVKLYGGERVSDARALEVLASRAN